MLTLKEKGSQKAYTVLKYLTSTNHRTHHRPESAKDRLRHSWPGDHQPTASLATGAPPERWSCSRTRPTLLLAQRDAAEASPCLDLLFRAHPSEGLCRSTLWALSEPSGLPQHLLSKAAGVCVSGFPNPVLFLLKSG